MTAQHDHYLEKVRVVKEDMACSKVPNKETLDAMKELDEGKGHSFDSIEDFWKQVEISPRAL